MDLKIEGKLWKIDIVRERERERDRETERQTERQTEERRNKIM